MNYKEIMTREELAEAEKSFARVPASGMLIFALEGICYLLPVFLGRYFLNEAKYTHHPAWFVRGWILILLSVYYIGDSFIKFRRTQLFKKTVKTEMQTGPAEEYIIECDGEKVTVNGTATVHYSNVRTGVFSRDYVQLIDRSKRALTFKISDENQVLLHNMLTDRKQMGRKIPLFVILDNPKTGYYLPEIEKKRKELLKKKKLKDLGITMVLAMVALVPMTAFIKDNTTPQENIPPAGAVYSYDIEKDLNTQISDVFEVTGTMKPVFDIYLDYCTQEFDGFFKFHTGKDGQTTVKICLVVDRDSSYVIELEDVPDKKQRFLSYGQFDVPAGVYLKEMAAVDYTLEKYPNIGEYRFWIIDGWNFNLKDNNVFTLGENMYYNLDATHIRYVEKDGFGENETVVYLKKTDEDTLDKVQKYFGRIETELKKPYDEQSIDYGRLRTDVKKLMGTED